MIQRNLRLSRASGVRRPTADVAQAQPVNVVGGKSGFEAYEIGKIHKFRMRVALLPYWSDDRGDLRTQGLNNAGAHSGLIGRWEMKGDDGGFTKSRNQSRTASKLASRLS